MSVLERLFRLQDQGTTVRTEVLAGLTTFVTMAYILFVNPNILGDAGMDKTAVLMATAVACAFGSILMGLFANLPFGLAPGMGMNAFFAYTVVLQMRIPWQTALACVFFDGVVFLLLSLFPIRERIIREIPYNIKLATASAIGLFITLIGLKSAGIVVANPVTLVQIGNLKSGPVLLAVAALLLIAWLLSRRVKGALLLGILAATLAGFLVPDGQGGTVSHWPGLGGLLQVPDLQVFGKVFLQLDLAGALRMGLVMIIFTFTFVSLFDTAGTFVGLGCKLGWIRSDRQIFPGAGRGLLAESFAIMAGALAGTSTTTTFIESASGISEGGRTGLTAVVTGLLFLGALFLAPLAGVVPPQATAPALVLVGFLMLDPVRKLDLDDFTEAVPAFLTLIMVPFSFNIANGLIWGILSYVALKALSGRAREVGAVMWVLAGLCLLSVWYH